MSKKSKNQISQKEIVRLRERELANGSKSLYLDIYRHGRREREFLKLYLIKEKDAIDREKNRQTLATARAIQANRQIKLQNGEYEFTHQFSPDTPFLQYYRKMCEDKFGPYEKDNWGMYHGCLLYLERYCDEHTTFREITKDWILGFKEFLDNVSKDYYKNHDPKNKNYFEGLALNTKKTYFSKLRYCINHAHKAGVIPYNPFVGVDGFPQSDAERSYLTVEEVQSLIKAPCRYPGLRKAFLFSCFTGLRKSDIEKLTWGELHKFGDYNRIIFKQKKTQHQEYMDINFQARELMGKPGDAEDLVFPNFKYSTWMLVELRRWALAAGISKYITFHTARHTFAVIMLTVGADIYTVSKLLGHRNIETTQIYAHIIDKKKQDAIDLLPTFEKPTDNDE